VGTGRLFYSACGVGPWAQNTLIINANVITIEKDHPSAQAFAFDNGRFTAVGMNEQILKLRTPSTVVLDLHGMAVTPGFNDAHLHPQAIFGENSPYYRVWLGGDRVKTISDLMAALQRKAAITPPGKLISGYGYNDVLLGRHPKRYDLDKVSTTQPIIITHGSGHISVVNSFILNEVGITRDTPDPPGGALDRDQDGTPNGVIRESARELLSRGRHDQQERGSDWRIVMPQDEEIRGYLNCFRQYSARGITSAGIAGGSPSSFRLMQELRDLGNPVRVGFMFSAGSFDELQSAGIQRGFGDNRLRITALKTFQGNSLSGRTAWLSQPYFDRPGYFGVPPARSQEELDADYEKWWNAGWQVATHSNGDREIDMVLTAIERAEQKNLRRMRVGGLNMRA
jgi:predicted amidohydrolase YtcJ